jgi:sulfoxide reductase heme-binding subunit YedZ
MLLAVAGTKTLWYLTRASGAVTLVLLTLTVVLGIANANRAKAAGWPRFVVEGVHRNASLLAIVLLCVHIATTVLDPFAAISLTAAIVPFSGSYRPIWVGLGALASDLLLAIAVTSIFRRRIGQRTWRATHWLAYACWPIAVVHTLGTGSDVRSWLGVLTVACVLTVVFASWWRTASGWPGSPAYRMLAVSASIAFPVGVGVWATGGPLARGWAARAGTPAALLARTTAGQATGIQAPAAVPALPLSTTVRGTVTEARTSTGVEVAIALSSPVPALGTIDVRIYGSALAGGGVTMTSSTVTAGSSALPAHFSGIVTGLAGSEIRARIGAAGDGVIELDLVLSLDAQTGGASGTLNAARPEGQ